MNPEKPEDQTDLGVSPLPEPDQQPLEPVKQAERFHSIDMLRGAAVLGILIINILVFALPQQAMQDPTLLNGSGTAHMIAWGVAELFFFQKFMTIFSLLFGAGVVLMYQRAEDRGVEFSRTYYRRVIILLALGFLHAYFWWGDILFSYAACGLLIWLFRRLSPTKLIIIGAAVMVMAMPLFYGLGTAINYIQDTGLEAKEAQEAGEELTESQRKMAEIWEGMTVQMGGSTEVIAEQIDDYRHNPRATFLTNAVQAIVAQTFLLFGCLCDIGRFLLEVRPEQ